MYRKDFAYHLPKELIAAEPTAERSGSRLLALNGVSGELSHQQFPQLIDHLQAGDVMVLNDTRVIPARLFGCKASGGKVEILVERVLDAQRVLAHVRASKSPKPDTLIELENGHHVTVTGRNEALFCIDFGACGVVDVLNAVGHMPLPPYIERQDRAEDQERYQTVYGCRPGAVAAPTAGLHFDEDMLTAIKAKGIQVVYVTLHVGAGTFQPVRVDNIKEHAMHSELMSLSEQACTTINQAKAAGQRVVAVGTTSVRCLETAALRSTSAELAPYEGETDIFITPGYNFAVVDALLTNFHLSESTLLMLVSAFAGYRYTMHAYAEAVSQRYRFFSYGDAMFLTRNPQAAEQIPR